MRCITKIFGCKKVDKQQKTVCVDIDKQPKIVIVTPIYRNSKNPIVKSIHASKHTIPIYHPKLIIQHNDPRSILHHGDNTTPKPMNMMALGKYSEPESLTGHTKSRLYYTDVRSAHDLQYNGQRYLGIGKYNSLDEIVAERKLLYSRN